MTSLSARSHLLLAVPCVWLLCAGLLSAAPPAWAESAGPEGWRVRYARMLDRHTRAVDEKVGTRVDYAALQDEPEWKLLLNELGADDPGRLTGREEKLAFWIDAYNIFAIDIVLQNLPVESIKDIGSFFRPVWKRTAGRIAGRDYSLGEIEHEILRPLGDSRIHGAIVCASISCPNLRREPYRPDGLDAQLDDNMRAWLARPGKGLAIDRTKKEIRISPIFDWFDEDFEAQGGVLAVVTRYAPEADQAWLRANGAAAEIEYFDYDWRLND